MPAPAKYTEVMSVIKRRIREGDYLLDNIPGERKIAEETGVSYMTARRAVQELLDEEVLIRQPSGSLDVHPGFTKRNKPAEVVLLCPAYPSSYLTQLRGLVSDFAAKRSIGLRPAQFVHWDEKTVVEAVDQAKGTFIIPYGPEIPATADRTVPANKVVILDGDFTRDGLPSIRLFSDRCIERVLDHLYTLGPSPRRLHQHPESQSGNRPPHRHLGALAGNGAECKGELRDDPAPVFTDPTIVAYRLMSRLVDEKQSKATAFIGTTCPAAIGAIRACWERDIRVGKDLSICTVNIEPPAEFFCPSITGLNTPDLSDVLGQVLRLVREPHSLARPGADGAEGIDSLRRRIHGKAALTAPLDNTALTTQ